MNISPSLNAVHLNLSYRPSQIANVFLFTLLLKALLMALVISLHLIILLANDAGWYIIRLLSAAVPITPAVEEF